MDSNWSSRARIWRKQRSPTKVCGVSMSMIGGMGSSQDCDTHKLLLLQVVHYWQ